MKITKTQLKRLIKEELKRVLNESDFKTKVERGIEAGEAHPVDTTGTIEDPEKALANVEAMKQRLLSLGSMSEAEYTGPDDPAPPSRLKDLLYTPLEEYIGDTAKQKALGETLELLAMGTVGTSLLPLATLMYSGAMGSNIALSLGTGVLVIDAIAFLLGSVGIDLQRRSTLK